MHQHNRVPPKALLFAMHVFSSNAALVYATVGAEAVAAKQEQHWALRHEIMESLVVYVRSPKSGDFKQVLPKNVYNPGKLLQLWHTLLAVLQTS